MSHAAGAMWGLLLIFCWLTWRQSRATRWVALAGLVAGAYAITRPLDALCVLLPVTIAWAWDIRWVPTRIKLMLACLAITLAAPFVALQLAFNQAVTGDFMQTPLERYNRDYLNVRSLGLQRYDPAFLPPTKSLQVQETYRQIDRGPIRDFTTVKSAAAQWFVRRVPLSVTTALPSVLLIVLVPVGLLGLMDIRRTVIFVVYVSYMAGSGFFYLFHDQYVMAVIPSVMLLALLGMNAVARAFPSWPAVAVFVPLAVFALSGYRLALNDQGVYEDPANRVMRRNYGEIAGLPGPALVLCRYDTAEHSLEEPVYNWNVDWPDDAPVVRAHDLGPRNIELFRHYRDIGQNRGVYLYDRESDKILKLGTITELAPWR